MFEHSERDKLLFLQMSYFFVSLKATELIRTKPQFPYEGKKKLEKNDLRYVASLGKLTELEKSEDPDTAGKGCRPRKSQPCLLQCILYCSDWNIYWNSHLGS